MPDGWHAAKFDDKWPPSRVNPLLPSGNFAECLALPSVWHSAKPLFTECNVLLSVGAALGKIWPC